MFGCVSRTSFWRQTIRLVWQRVNRVYSHVNTLSGSTCRDTQTLFHPQVRETKSTIQLFELGSKPKSSILPYIKICISHMIGDTLKARKNMRNTTSAPIMKNFLRKNWIFEPQNGVYCAPNKNIRRYWVMNPWLKPKSTRPIACI